ncbi:cytidine deaminase [Coprothermobacteraceae bacterium]|nr:cytidine deaminase [Coprothermobacteraceae bacterium]
MNKEELLEKYAFLIEAAKRARVNAVAPFSSFTVGAALLGKSGRVYVGANIEPGVMNLGLCAERTALFSALAQGEKEFEAIAVYAGTEDVAHPCGACRQVFSDLAPNVTWILVGDKQVKIETLDSLLPGRFVLEDLRR